METFQNYNTTKHFVFQVDFGLKCYPQKRIIKKTFKGRHLNNFAGFPIDAVLAAKCDLSTSSPLGIPAVQEQTGIHRPEIRNQNLQIFLDRKERKKNP